MTNSSINLEFALLSRFCFYMAGLSCVFWFTSWPNIPYVTELVGYGPLPRDFPNCVSARADNSILAVGHLSHNRISSLFITTEELEPGRADWSERADGHFCGFNIPPYLYLNQPDGFGVHVSSRTIGWDCPYWLMAALWTLLLLKTRTQLRFRLLDLFLATTLVAAAITLIRLRLALVLTVFLNASTVLLLAYLAYSSISVLFRGKELRWPFTIQ